ncbi:cytochrome P450 [Mycena alexandri]|uniref:Cytochrome P450 n=1 Tax=Mycena alexandri TaxID=1745969 RepID=A0AAD6SR39_9AGAR|nr:cytochrome P450 [Mycena alexandri]
MLSTAYPLALLLVAISALIWRRFYSKQLPLPPGPPTRFLIGNLHQLPEKEPWLQYAEWAKEHGPLITLRTFHHTQLILNSAKSALDLLERRSAVYSDRPMSWMLSLARRDVTMFQLSSLDSRFPKYRKMLHSGLNRRATQVYRPTQDHQLRVLLKGLAASPDKFIAHSKTYVASIALKIAYGYNVSTDDDYLVKLIDEAARVMTEIGQPFFFVQTFPFLRFLPSWFPLAKFKRVLTVNKPVLDTLEAAPIEWAEKAIDSGNYTESFFSQYFHPEGGQVVHGEEKDILNWTAGSIYAGGAHTTTSAIASFFLLMSTHPEIQKEAQDEIDRVIGRDQRLPTLEDQKALPYVSAVLKEVLRWAPVAPLGLKHCVTKDDFYEGYFIPKGTTVIANIWAITHDSEVYANPFAFDPTRHLGENPEADPFNFVFGYGRRVCPGATLAEDSLFLAISNILAAFNISRALDANGKEVEPCVEWRTSIVTLAMNFGCRIVPRSPDLLASLGV